MTDDVSIIEALGKPVKITAGSYTNIKVWVAEVSHLWAGEEGRGGRGPCVLCVAWLMVCSMGLASCFGPNSEGHALHEHVNMDIPGEGGTSCAARMRRAGSETSPVQAPHTCYHTNATTPCR